METINAGVENLNTDITEQFLNENKNILWSNRWRAFRAEWKTFYAANGSLWDRLWGSTYDTLESFRKRLDSWRDDFQSTQGGVALGPTLPPPPVAPDTSTPLLTQVKRFAIIGGAVLAALYVAPFAVKQIMGAKRAHATATNPRRRRRR